MPLVTITLPAKAASMSEIAAELTNLGYDPDTSVIKEVKTTLTFPGNEEIEITVEVQ